MGTKANESTGIRLRREFVAMWSNESMSKTTKGSKMSDRRFVTIECFEWSLVIERLGGRTIVDMDCS